MSILRILLTLVQVSIRFWIKASSWSTVCMPTGSNPRRATAPTRSCLTSEDAVVPKDKLVARGYVVQLA